MTTYAFPFACVAIAMARGRDGAPLADAPLRSEGLDRRALEVLVEGAAAAGARTIVALVPSGVQAPPPARAVTVAEDLGMLRALRIGLAQLANSPVEGALLWPVEHAGTPLAVVMAVLDGFKRHHAAVVVPVADGEQRYPTFIAREAWPDVMTATGDDVGVALARHTTAMVQVEGAPR